LNWVDFAILGLMAWFTFTAFRSGLIREVVTIGGAVLAVFLAGHFYLRLAEDFEVAIDDKQAAEVAAFLVIFGATVLGAQMVAMFLKRAASLFMLGPWDAMGGAVLGAAKAFVIIELLLIAGISFPDLHVQGDIADSSLAPVFLDALPVLKFLLPHEFKDAIDAF